MVALNIFNGTLVRQQTGFVANAPEVNNTVYLMPPGTNNVLEEFSPITGKVIERAVFDDTRFLPVLFETSDGFMYYSKDGKYIHYVDRSNMKIIWSSGIDISLLDKLPYSVNDYFAFDIPITTHNELGKRTYILDSSGFTDTTYVADVKTGKILWKARIEGDNPIVVRTVLARNNMAFIKTAAGNVFAVKWENKKQ